MKKKILIIVLFLFFAFLFYWYLLDDNKNFYNIAKKEYNIPGLETSFSSQGLSNTKDDYILVSGYMADKTPSRIYIIDKKSNNVKYVTLKYNGKDYIEHAGGIATDGNNVWICSSGKVYNFSYDKLLNIKNGDSIELEGMFESNNGADFLTIENGNLWVGEFYKRGSYDTLDSHHIKVGNTTNYAVSYRYSINALEKTGLESIPNLALSTRGLVQGMAINDERIILSTSYALPKSHIFYYKNILDRKTNKEIKYNNSNIPLLILEDKDIVKDLVIPSMSEEIDITYNRLFVMFENATRLYKFFTRERIRGIYSIPIY